MHDGRSWAHRAEVFTENNGVHFHLGCCTARGLLIALMMDAVTISEMSVNFYQTAQHTRKHLHSCRRENLKSHQLM
jgi:hypothetical protein